VQKGLQTGLLKLKNKSGLKSIQNLNKKSHRQDRQRKRLDLNNLRIKRDRPINSNPILNTNLVLPIINTAASSTVKVVMVEERPEERVMHLVLAVKAEEDTRLAVLVAKAQDTHPEALAAKVDIRKVHAVKAEDIRPAAHAAKAEDTLLEVLVVKAEDTRQADHAAKAEDTRQVDRAAKAEDTLLEVLVVKADIRKVHAEMAIHR
jgi:hypothetical protein